MPLNNKPPPIPPKVMTWPKAAPILLLAVIFDGIRFMFEQFWLFAPALAAVLCTGKVSVDLTAWTFGILGTKTAALACTALSSVVGIALIEVTVVLGVVLAMAVGLLGWLIIGSIILIWNQRLLKENPRAMLSFVMSLMVSEVPLVGTIPAFTIILWRLYHTQIQADRSAYKRYTQDHASYLDRIRREQEQRQAMQTLQQAQILKLAAQQRQQATNDDTYAQDEAFAA